MNDPTIPTPAIHTRHYRVSVRSAHASPAIAMLIKMILEETYDGVTVETFSGSSSITTAEI